VNQRSRESISKGNKEGLSAEPAAGAKRPGATRAWTSIQAAIRVAADKVRRFSLVQIWGLWLLALALLVWILVRDWLT
jgi:hypothetical protein